jgi:hypothetical protein
VNEGSRHEGASSFRLLDALDQLAANPPFTARAALRMANRPSGWQIA